MENLILLSLAVMETLWPVFRGGWMRLIVPYDFAQSGLSYSGWSDLKITKSASHKVTWCSLLCRNLHCSLGLVIKPDHLWGTESYLHINNGSEACHSQQLRFTLAPTSLWLQKAGGASTTATVCREMPSLVFGTAGILLHELGESNQLDILTSVSKDHDLLKNSP